MGAMEYSRTGPTSPGPVPNHSGEGMPNDIEGRRKSDWPAFMFLSVVVVCLTAIFITILVTP